MFFLQIGDFASSVVKVKFLREGEEERKYIPLQASGYEGPCEYDLRCQFSCLFSCTVKEQEKGFDCYVEPYNAKADEGKVHSFQKTFFPFVKHK